MDIQFLVKQAQAYNPKLDAARLTRAYETARAAHAGQTRATGEAYVLHSLEVARILADLHFDEDTLIAALLHDVPEDTTTTLETLREQFGDHVAKMVDGVTKLSQLRLGLEQTKAESLRKMFFAMAEEIRVVIIKLADRLHNMRTLHGVKPEKQKRIARETLEIFAPLANRLGIYTIRRELEDLALFYLEPEKYKEIEALLAEDKDDQQSYIRQAITILREKLAHENLRVLEVTGRPKHIYSIYNKMERKGRDLSQIYDLRAVRVIVESARDCYVVLGVVHNIWTPIPAEFDDFIARPKDNLYQSLHTAVIGPDGKALEVQIRTAEMHRIAEFGIAAHWKYKEAGTVLDPNLENKINWVRQLMDWQKDIADADVFVDSLRTDVFQDQVYVFSPKGDIYEMANGATPIDFAYHVHTEIGNRCRGAKVNGRIAPLDQRLKTGDRVEILTAKKGGPSRDWLNPGLGLVLTTRAREKIRHYFKHQARAEAIAQGRTLLEKEFHRLGIVEWSFENIAAMFSYKDVDDFLEALGHEDVSISAVSVKLLDAERTVSPPETLIPAPVLRKFEPTLKVEGITGLLQRLGRCCNPLPGDEVIGFITRGRGITIHRRDCRNVLNMDTERDRLLKIDWKQSEAAQYPVLIEVAAFDRGGLLADISNIVAAEGISMSSASATVNRTDRMAKISATLEISSADQLTRVLKKIDRLQNVLEARRVTNS
ncbi:MAG: bifunctional (p)ppGpp synthetase/guanosine-3',5'-bis(diphosphate) 3'-pyrophosphohydrolase [Chloroflexi bacterium]|nr:bifunctional (p)ppGpp synthetase/guanosine-3',5'-bis(diphosphate) 3'-pyrophosphohydrolase [Chloroflexota bacterium]